MQKELAALNSSMKNNAINKAPQDIINQLVNIYNQGQFSVVVEQAESIINQYPEEFLVWNILGASKAQIGMLHAAIDAYNKSISIKPDFFEAHNNLGNMFNRLGKLKEAETSYRQAIKLKPNFASAYSNLGLTLQEMNELEEAKLYYMKAISLNSECVEARYNLSTVLSHLNDLEGQIITLQNLFKLDTKDIWLKAGVNLAICLFLKGEFSQSRHIISKVSKIQDQTHPKFKNAKNYQNYLLKILKWHENKHFNVNKRKDFKTLFVIGESHSLNSHHIQIKHSRIEFICKAKLIKGCMQWHLGNPSRNKYKHQFESIYSSLPKHSDVLLTIGEIDCRLESGIVKHQNKYPDRDIKDIIVKTINNYFNYILSVNSIYQHNIIIQGVPCPNVNKNKHTQNDILKLVNVIKIFNCLLKLVL